MLWRGICQCATVLRKSVDVRSLPLSISQNSSVASQNSFLSKETSKLLFNLAKLVVIKTRNKQSISKTDAQIFISERH